MSITNAIPAPITINMPNGSQLTFRKIGLDIWAEFCEWVVGEPTTKIMKLDLADSAKASLYKDLVKNGLDMEDMLREASTMGGMSWMISRCCTSDGVDKGSLLRVLPFEKVTSLFERLADVEQEDPETSAALQELGGNALPEKQTG